MSYDYFGLQTGQAGGSPINVVTGTVDLATAITDSALVVTDLTTAETDINTTATQATYGLVTLLNNQTYTAGTGQLSGTPGSSVTLTVAQQESFIANFNAMSAAVIATATPAAAVVTALGSLNSDLIFLANNGLSNAYTTRTAMLAMDVITRFIQTKDKNVFGYSSTQPL